jgi:hypothetical protein
MMTRAFACRERETTHGLREYWQMRSTPLDSHNKPCAALNNAQGLATYTTQQRWRAKELTHQRTHPEVWHSSVALP